MGEPHDSKPIPSPFPYYGCKRRWALDIWARFGAVDAYYEPFFGTGAVLFASEPHDREVVCDLNGFIANFWRAIQGDPDQVAHWADYPSIHQDLTARHKWLHAWGVEHASRLSEDPDFYDAKAAGWWVWGMSLWIGNAWCRPTLQSGIPLIDSRGGGQGVSQQRKNIPGDQMPLIDSRGGGQGVLQQRKNIPGDQMPHIDGRGGGEGVSSQRLRGRRLEPWFQSLADRLKGVVVLNRSWTSICHSKTVLMDTATTSTKKHRAIFLDPPYDQKGKLYGTPEVAQEVYDWAVEAALRPGYRIAMACHEGDFSVPDGWTIQTSSFGGIRKPERRGVQDAVLFSPQCLQSETSQGVLL